MLKLFQSLLQTKFSFLKEAPVLVAVSGGLDSMVLVDLCNQSGLNSSLAHCNFKLRGDESDADANFIKSYAKAQNIKAFTTSFETRLMLNQLDSQSKWQHVNSDMSGFGLYKMSMDLSMY